ncbi:MAG: hypothetical protein KZQ99_07770 [Candidatus Thiodiazotropha sp. (ex Dulcina madagascariensis)]|nr:hypothetical protein [Candidatus Thiodiazotropha sp. (ex Dulcina madagascariensis)]
MEIAVSISIFVLFGLYLIFKSTRIGAAAKSKIKVDDFQEQIEAALNLPQESGEAWQNEPATQAMMQELDERGIWLNRPLTKGQAMNVLGLFSPPDGRQVDILKHFNIPYSFKMNQTMAYYLIRELFSDPQKVAEWNNRPPTTTVRQGLLFMEGRLIRGLTHVKAQAKLDQLGMDNPTKYQEWKQIDRLFLETNNPEIRAKYKVRKIIWKRFFKSYDALKTAGINPHAMCGENIIEQTLRQDDKIMAHAKIRDAMQPASF